MNIRRHQAGFTIVELMIASMVFSVVLLLATYGVIQIGRMYYKGIISSRTQEVARAFMDNVAQSIQFNGGSVAQATNFGTVRGYCIGNKLYSYVPDQKVTDSPVVHGLVVNTPSGQCSQAQNFGALTADSQELLAPNMRLARFNICFPGSPTPACPSPAPAGSNLYQVEITVIYGDTDLLNPAHDACNANLSAGGQFCAVSNLSTVVQKRIQ